MYKTGGNIMINFKQHMENIHPCLLEYFEYLEGKINDALSSGSKTTVVLSYDKFLPQEYDILISGMIGQIATGEAHSNDDRETTLSDDELNIIKNAYFLVFRSSGRAVIYYNNNKMWRDTTQMEYYCMDNEIGRKLLINPTTKVMKLVRTGV